MEDNFIIDITVLMEKHPDELNVWELLYLRNSRNRAVLDKYLDKWREIVKQRQQNVS